MRIMYPDKITVLAADEENTHYPATNLQDGHANNLWKATSKDAVVTLTVSAGASAVAVFNTNATSVKVATTDTSADTTVTYDLTTSNEKSFWAEYSATIIEHTVVLTFEAAVGDIVEAGVISAGTSILFADPKYGIREGLVDYSIIKKLKNGAFYLKDTNVARTFSGRVTVDRGDDTTIAGTITQANCKKSLVDGTAFIDIGIDLSAYASSSHRYEFRLIDSAGNIARGYIGSSGAGETLGGEMIDASDDRDFTTWGNVNWTGYSGGGVADGTGKMEVTLDIAGGSGAVLGLDEITGETKGELYKITADLWKGTTLETSMRLQSFGAYNSNISISGVQITYDEYITASSVAGRFFIYFDHSDGGTFYVDDVSLKQVTDCSTNGVHIFSAETGSTQNWTDIEDGFDYNDSSGYTYQILGDYDFYTFMLDTAKALGSNSFACRISTNVTDWEWVVYVRFDGMPKGSHSYPDDSIIDFSLIESL